jgi:hypothetical protein
VRDHPEEGDQGERASYASEEHPAEIDRGNALDAADRQDGGEHCQGAGDRHHEEQRSKHGRVEAALKLPPRHEDDDEPAGDTGARAARCPQLFHVAGRLAPKNTQQPGDHPATIGAHEP